MPSPTRTWRNVMAVDEAVLMEFVGKAVGDLGSALTAGLVVVGDKLGLYKAMAHSGPLTSTELAAKTGTTERMVREWLNAQAASGYLTFDPATQRYELPDEHAEALANDESPACVLGGFQMIVSTLRSESKIADAFRTG